MLDTLDRHRDHYCDHLDYLNHYCDHLSFDNFQTNHPHGHTAVDAEYNA